MPDPNRITRLAVTNFGALTEVDIQVPKDTVLTGKKGAGKSTVLEALRAVLTGKGLRPDLVKLGEDKATLLVELSDGTVIKRTLKGASTTAALSVEKGGMHPAKPQTFLDALLGPHCFNPVDFFNLSAQDQASELLALTAVSMTSDEYKELSGDGPLPGVDYDQHPLRVIADIEKALFADRAAVNRDMKQKRGAADEALAKIPEGFAAEVVRGASLGDLVDQQTAARQQNREIEQKQAELGTTGRELASLLEQVKKLEQSETALAVWLEEHAEIDTAALDQQIHDFQEQQDLLRLHDAAKAAAEEAAQLARQSARLTELIEAARVKPGELLAGLEDLPVAGMGIDAEHGVTINGVPLADLSHGEGIDLAIEIALRYAGDLPLLLVDGLEALDPESQEQLRAKLTASDCQCVVTRVGEDELEIQEW